MATLIQITCMPNQYHVICVGVCASRSIMGWYDDYKTFDFLYCRIKFMFGHDINFPAHGRRCTTRQRFCDCQPIINLKCVPS